jgi:enoyl-CoA hydratase/carnithine racemase
VDCLLRERIEPGIEMLRLNRPERRNAIDSELLGGLVAALEALAADATLRVLVLSTTNTRALSAGADISERLDRAGGEARTEAFSRLYELVEAFPAPIVCVCVGNVVGAGAELAAGSDLRVGGENLRLAWAGARMGIPVGPARLAPLVGGALARELIFTGRTVDAEDALAMGLVGRVVPAEQAEAAAVELATALAGYPPGNVRRLKAMFREFEGRPLAERVALENEAILELQRHGPGLPSARREE